MTSTDSMNPDREILPKKGIEKNTLYARGIFYKMLSSGFAYPDEEALKTLRDTSYVEGASEAAEEIGNHKLVRMLSGLIRCTNEASQSSLEAEYNRLFTGQTKLSLNGTDYHTNPFVKSKELADISGFYRAFKIKPKGERPDFIGMELEFMYVLLVKEAYAVHEGWRKQATICLDAEKKFFTEYFRWWVPRLCESLSKKTQHPYYRALSKLLDAFVQSEIDSQITRITGQAEKNEPTN